MINIKKIKKDFPILNKSLVYLDSSATSQKPNQVILAIENFYKTSNANVHRGLYPLSEKATDLYESSRKKVAEFIGAKNFSEVIFTKGTTESLNTVAFGWVENNLQRGDEIMFVDVDHHSNIVPYQIVASRVGAKINIVSVNSDGVFDMKGFKEKLNKNVKFVSVAHVSNVLGTIFPIKEICKLAKEVGAVVSVDGAQAVPHMRVNVQSLGCDFYSFSGHKMLGPMGIGVLWGKKERLKEMQPVEFGGGMIKEVHVDNSTWADIPQRFEAGTPNVAGAVGLSAAIDYLQKLDIENVEEHERSLVDYAVKKLSKIEDLTILGPKDLSKRAGLVSFIIKDIHSHDLAAVLSEYNIAVRSGQHCTIPLHEKLNISSSVRASFYIYNTKSDVNKLVEGLKKAKEVLK